MCLSMFRGRNQADKSGLVEIYLEESEETVRMITSRDMQSSVLLIFKVAISQHMPFY